MRVALVDPASYTPPYDHALAVELARRGHEVHLLTSAFVFDRPPEPEGYERHEVFLPLSTRLARRAPRSRVRLLAKAAEYGPSALRLARRIERLDPDVVHLQWLPLPRADVRWVRWLARRRPTVLTAHDVVPRRRGQLAPWLDALRAVDRVVVHSDRAVEKLAGLGVARGRLVRVTHPIFPPDGAGAVGAPTGSTLLFFGLLREYKGLDLLVEALPALLERVPEARLVVAGDPVDPVERVRARAEALGVGGRIDWRLRFVRREEIPALMGEAAALVLPYRELDSSGVLATAIGYGRPAVVSDVGSLGEIVREFGIGRVVPAGDVAALAEACAGLLSDPEALAEAGRRTEDAARALSWEESAGRHEELYREVASERAR